MKNLKLTVGIILLTLIMIESTYSQDWANLNRYQKENKALGLSPLNETRVVFIGNSITEGWSLHHPEFFMDKPYINRGIGGQTTPQMLIRFRQDVIDLKPTIVVILAGTNDIAGNTGPMTLEMIVNNIISMTEIAHANGIKVIISSVLPAFDYSWKPGLNPDKKIPMLNDMLKQYAENKGFVYLDYFASMVDEENGLKKEYGADGVHPNKTGYKVMEPLVEKAINDALNKK
jgi:lysophospholipase L1-like esterase